MSTAADPRYPEERRGVLTSGKLFAGLGLTLLAAAAVAAYGYFAFLRYERVAAHHVPDDATWALRLDVEQVVLFEPVRKHLLPLLNEMGAPGSAGPSRFERFTQATGVRLQVDLRELLWASGPSSGDWLLIVGGKFPHEGVTAGVASVLIGEGIPWTGRGDEFEGPGGLGLGQAADGAMILASSLSRLRAALPARADHSALGLGSGKAGGFFYQAREPAGGLGERLSALLIPAPFGDVARADGELVLGSDVTLEASLVLAPTCDVERARRELETSTEAARAFASWLGPGAMALIEALGPITTRADGKDRLHVQVTLQRPAIEQGAAVLASWFRRED